MEFDKLVELMARLRGEGGCPWDKKQTVETLKPYLIEETYELVDAIESKEPRRIKEELGDLLFQIVFVSQICADNKWFSIDDVVEKTVVLSDEYGGDVVFGHGHATSPVGSTFGDEVTHSANTATFNPRGLGKSGYIYIANRKGRSIAIGTRSTGMIVMKKWNESISRWD